MNSSFTKAALLALGAALAACGGGEGTEQSQEAIVDGRAASGHRYDVVGALVTIAPDGSTNPFCTGTLISGRNVVTAKHCALLTPTNAQTGFAIGPDAFHPTRVIPIDRYVWERTITNGALGLGADVAVAHLSQPVRDIRPVYAQEAARWEIGRSFQAVGYGTTAFADPSAPYGQRKQAELSLVALGPSPYFPAVYRGDFGAFLADLAAGEGVGVDDPELQALAQDEWAGFLLEPHNDAVFQRVTGNTAPGDSGGPIFSSARGRHGEREDEHERSEPLRTVGVVSGIVTVSGSYPDSVVDNFSVYSTFGPEAAHLLRSAEACGAVSEEGKCAGDVRHRCTSLAESRGRPRVVSEDCARAGLRCAETPQGAACLPSCQSDADCAGGGICAQGQCQWSPVAMCAGESSPFACYLCCLGRGTGGSFTPEDFDTCGNACFPPLPESVPAAGPTRAVRFPGFPGLPALPLR